MQALQAFKLQLNCEEDAVYDDKGNKILIHNVSVSKKLRYRPVFQQAHDAQQKPHVKRLVLVKANWNDETSQERQKERPTFSPLQVTESIDRGLFPFKQNGWIVFVAGRSFVLGPFRSRRIILPFKFSETTTWTAFFDCTHNKNIFCKVKVHTNGQISVVIFNQSDVPQHITSKMRLCCAKDDVESIVDVDGTEHPLRIKTKRVNIMSMTTPIDKDAIVAQLREEFPLVFFRTPFARQPVGCGTSRYATEIFVGKASLSHAGGRTTSQISHNDEISKEIDSLQKEGVIRPLPVAEAIHAVVAPLNFIRKPNGKIRPIIDFRDINTYLEGTQGGPSFRYPTSSRRWIPSGPYTPLWTLFTATAHPHRRQYFAFLCTTLERRDVRLSETAARRQRQSGAFQ